MIEKNSGCWRDKGGILWPESHKSGYSAKKRRQSRRRAPEKERGLMCLTVKREETEYKSQDNTHHNATDYYQHSTALKLSHRHTPSKTCVKPSYIKKGALCTVLPVSACVPSRCAGFLLQFKICIQCYVVILNWPFRITSRVFPFIEKS